MQHRERRRPQPAERSAIVEISDERDDAMGAQLAHVVAIARESDQVCAIAKAIGDAQRDIPATHEQHPLHHASGADANVDTPPEPCMPVLTQLR
jgi:hypothetical protein